MESEIRAFIAAMKQNLEDTNKAISDSLESFDPGSEDDQITYDSLVAERNHIIRCIEEFNQYRIRNGL
jgi:hypothetical protein